MAAVMNQADIRIVNTTPDLQLLYKHLQTRFIWHEGWVRPPWDDYFMGLASLAAQRSNCMKRRVGCVLVRDNRVISTGYNGTPRSMKNCNAGGCKPLAFPMLIRRAGHSGEHRVKVHAATQRTPVGHYCRLACAFTPKRTRCWKPAGTGSRKALRCTATRERAPKQAASRADPR